MIRYSVAYVDNNYNLYRLNFGVWINGYIHIIACHFGQTLLLNFNILAVILNRNGWVYTEWLIWFHIWSCNSSPYSLYSLVKLVLSSSCVNMISESLKFYVPHSESTLKEEPGDGYYLGIPHVLFTPDMSYFRPHSFTPGGVSKFVEMSELLTAIS